MNAQKLADEMAMDIAQTWISVPCIAQKEGQDLALFQRSYQLAKLASLISARLLPWVQCAEVLKLLVPDTMTFNSNPYHLKTASKALSNLPATTNETKEGE